MVDENIQTGFSTVAYTPGRETRNPEGLYINMAAVKQDFLDPYEMSFMGHQIVRAGRKTRGWTSNEKEL